MEAIEKSYVPYHVHTHYSLLDSCSTPEDYIKLCVENGHKAISFSEHGKPLNWVSKKKLCEENGVLYIHGVEIYLTEALLQPDPETGELKKVRDNYHTILIARNADGVRELNKLITLSSQEDHMYYTNRLSFEEFLGISDNIISTSACLASPLNKLPMDHPMYEKLVQKYTFLEVQPHDNADQIAFNQRLLRLAKYYDKPLIAGTDTHSASAYKAECRDILLESKHKKYDDDGFDLTYKTYDELVAAFEKQGVLPEDVYLRAIDNTNLLIELVEPFELDKEAKYPILYGSREKDANVFKDRVWTMFKDKLDRGVIPPEQEQAFRTALQDEIDVLLKLNMGGFMLSMSEILCWCKEQGFAIGTARGSVGGSRVAYVTDIIDLNPETWNTSFYRFANPNRVELGDIDVDCVETDRPKIFQYIIERFGKQYTARVASYGTMAPRATIDNIGRCFRDRYEEQYGKDVPNPWAIPNVNKIKTEFENDEQKAREKWPDLFYYYDGLVGTLSSQSVHPAGMVISNVNLDTEFGVFIKDGERCLILDMEDAHTANLCKYDLLVLKTVQVIRDTCSYIGEKYPQTYQMDFADPNVWEDMIKSHVGLFQFEAKHSFDNLKKFQPRSVEDVTLVTAAIRPSGASYRDELLARHPHHNGSELIDSILKDNYGYLVYQEDMIQILMQACGLDGGTSDSVRRGISKKKLDILEKYFPAILDGYCANSDKKREDAEAEAKEIIQVLVDSASYQFGKNHAIAYSILTFFTAYYRCYHPLEFITAFLNNAANDEDILNGTILAKQKGIQITNPKFGVSRGDYFFDKETNRIAKGLKSIKYIGEAVAEEMYKLSQENKYTCFSDLLYDIATKTTLDSRQLDILIKIDFFSDYGNQRELFAINDIFNLFKQGFAKKIKKEMVDGTQFEEAVKRHSTDKKKDGTDAKSYTLLDPMQIVRECEDEVKKVGMNDLSLILKARNFMEAMGYPGYFSGEEADRNKLYIKDVFPVKRKSDGEVFAYNVLTASLGSGIESSMTVMLNKFKNDPIKKNDIIVCKRWHRDKSWFRMDDYEHYIA